MPAFPSVLKNERAYIAFVYYPRDVAQKKVKYESSVWRIRRQQGSKGEAETFSGSQQTQYPASQPSAEIGVAKNRIRCKSGSSERHERPRHHFHGVALASRVGMKG